MTMLSNDLYQKMNPLPASELYPKDKLKQYSVEEFREGLKKMEFPSFGLLNDLKELDAQTTSWVNRDFVKSLETKIQELEKRLAAEGQIVANIHSLNIDLTMRLAAVEDLRKGYDLMEMDIARIRNAIGDIKMNEILGVKK